MDNTLRDFNLKKIVETLKPSSVTMLVGAAGAGKTVLALNIATQYGVYEGKNVAIFSIELLEKHIIQGILCLLADVNLRSACSGQLTTEEWERIQIASAKLAQSNIFIDDTSQITTQYITKKIEDIVQKHGNIDLIIIDFLQLILPLKESSNRSRLAEVADILNELEVISKKYNVPILVLAQLIRSDYNYNKFKPINEITVNEIAAGLTISRYNSFKGQWLILRSNDTFDESYIGFVHGEDADKIIPLKFDKQTGQFSECDNEE